MIDYRNDRNSLFLFFLLIVLITLGKYYIYIGFALKPYMMFLFLFFILKMTTFYFVKLHLYEYCMLMFYLIYSYTGAFSLYPIESIRIILGIILLIFCYFIMRFFLINYTPEGIENALGYAGIIFNGISLILFSIALNLYPLGVINIGGIMMDRDYPRLIGIVSDPNYYIFYNSIFFTYFLCNSNGLKNKVGLILCITTNLLTFSRGGLIAMVVVFVMYVLMCKPLKQLKLLFSSIFFLTLFSLIALFSFKIDFLGMISSRVQDFSSDGGSGRFELWSRAWNYFGDNSFFGVGAFNFKEYNAYDFSDTHFVHNTFLEILSESGVIGFSFYSLFLLVVFFQLLENNFLKEKPYLVLTFILFLFQMSFLTFFISEIFLLYLAIVATYIHHKQCTNNESEG